MLRPLAALCLLLATSLVAADEPQPFKLAAPDGWGGETIQLPPGFAKDMKFKGAEHIRFAPGMMKPDSTSFFSYAFVFELQREPEMTEAVLKSEFLKYYRGLCTTVLNGKVPDLDPADFKLELERVKSETKPDPSAPILYTGTLDWLEPFATKKPQKLNLEFRTWTKEERDYLFVCVSPQARDTAIWKQLHTIRDDYLKSQK